MTGYGANSNNPQPVLYGFDKDSISANPSPTYCITSDTAARAQPCDVYVGANNVGVNTLEGIAVFFGNVYVANNGGGNPGHYIYNFYPSGNETPVPAGGMGHLIQPSYVGSNAAGDSTEFQCPGGLFATGSLFV